jgi:hypothetical protein
MFLGVAMATLLASCGSSGLEAPTPVLGRQMAEFATLGIGQVRPSHIDYGGTADSTVLNVAWSSWGGKQAIGSGTWCPGGQKCGAVRIVAFNLGDCHGNLMYQALEWYLTQSQVDPGYGHTFDPNIYRDICTETWVAG